MRARAGEARYQWFGLLKWSGSASKWWEGRSLRARGTASSRYFTQAETFACWAKVNRGCVWVTFRGGVEGCGRSPRGSISPGTLTARPQESGSPTTDVRSGTARRLY